MSRSMLQTRRSRRGGRWKQSSARPPRARLWRFLFTPGSKVAKEETQSDRALHDVEKEKEKDSAQHELWRGAVEITPLAAGVAIYGLAFGLLAAQASLSALHVGIM